MLLTTSKHAGTALKRLAAKLAGVLPGCTLMRRGEQGLERIEELAERRAEDMIIVMGGAKGEKGGKNKLDSSFILRSRKLAQDANGAAGWAWQAQEMVVEKVEFAAGRKDEEAADEPYSISARGQGAKKIALFLGLKDHVMAEYYDDAPKVEVEEGGGGNSFTISTDKGRTASVKYLWQALCAKE